MRWPPRSIARFGAAGGLVVWTAAIGAGSDRPVLGVAIGIAATAGLLVAPRYPFAVLALAVAGIVAMAGLTGYDGPDDAFVLAIAWASYGVGRHESLRRQPWAAAAVLFFLSLNVSGDDAPAFPSNLVFPILFVSAPWLVGLWIQRLDERSQRAMAVARDTVDASTTAVTRATAEERLRLAREIHDVAAHHMTVVALQAQVLRERTERGSPPTGDELAAIGESSRLALAEIRRVVGVLRETADAADLAPMPSVEDLPMLVSDCCRAGQSVELAVEGAPRSVPDGVGLTLYRIAQETLSNARRHGHGRAARLLLRWDCDRVVLTTTNPTRRVDRFDAGNGIAGMRERVELYGGRLDAGPDRVGNWVVAVTIPLPA